MLSRRRLLQLSGTAVAASAVPTWAQPSADHKITIGPVDLQLGPKLHLRTTGYNGQVPGPLLRLQEGRPLTIELHNNSDRPEVVHWHGLFLPSETDGAAEEGTPMLAPGASTRMTFTPRPAGFRWYHTHTMAGNDLTRAQYGGQHGFLLVEPRDNPAPYDAEFFLALHDWRGQLSGGDDGTMNPIFDLSTINGKVMGSGEPLRVKQGQRAIFHILNSSPVNEHWIALAGHTFEVLALDGNPVPTPARVPMLRLAPAERVSAIVELNNPGVWTLGEVREHVQKAGMAIAVEYAGQTGTPKWKQPPELLWSYEPFSAPATQETTAASAIEVPLVLEPRFKGHGAMEDWLINGKMYPHTSIAPLQRGQRYRLRFINRSSDDHPMHLHRHSFELLSLDMPLNLSKKPSKTPAQPVHVRGIRKDTVLVSAQTEAVVEFLADNPGNTLLHCHQQNHMDLGFMMLLTYA